MFLYTKSRHFKKKQDNLRHVFNIKKPKNMRYANFHENFDIGGWGGTFIRNKKNALCVKFLYTEIIISIHFYIQKTKHYASYLYTQKTMHYALSFYIYN